MKKPRGKPAASGPVAAERPRAGGSYVRDRNTGELTRVEQTSAAPIGAGTVADPAPDETGDSVAIDPVSQPPVGGATEQEA